MLSLKAAAREHASTLAAGLGHERGADVLQLRLKSCSSQTWTAYSACFWPTPWLPRCTSRCALLCNSLLGCMQCLPLVPCPTSSATKVHYQVHAA